MDQLLKERKTSCDGRYLGASMLSEKQAGSTISFK